jgi:nucleoside-diphosphate-sugar epimerase
MRRALVTGSAGLIGRHVTPALEGAGFQVTGIDLPCVDARDFFRATAGTRFDLVVHAAAIVGGRATIDGAPLALAVNLVLDAEMFQWAVRSRPGRVVYLSSSAAYPVALQRQPYRLRESDIDLRAPKVPDQLYGWAKLTGEVLAERARAEGLAVTVCRSFSGYAEDQDDCYPFPALARRARRREDPFTVWGSGAQVRDFVHIDDIVAAVLLMAREGIDGPVNLGTGRPTSMLELATMMCAAAGYEPEIEMLPEMPSGVPYRVAEPSKMLAFYTPRVALAEGVARSLERTPA